MFSVNLSSDSDKKLQIYRDHFEKAYLEATEEFYKTKAPEYLTENGVQNYMHYAASKLKEEEQRAFRYLETRKGCNSVTVVSILVTNCTMVNWQIIVYHRNNIVCFDKQFFNGVYPGIILNKYLTEWYKIVCSQHFSMIEIFVDLLSIIHTFFLENFVFSYIFILLFFSWQNAVWKH